MNTPKNEKDQASVIKTDDFGQSVSQHHDYNRGSMSGSEPHNKYGTEPRENSHTESRQSPGRGYGADNTFGRGYGSQEIYGPAPSDHAYSKNPGPQSQRPDTEPTGLNQPGSWDANSEMYGQKPEQGKNAGMKKP